MTTMENNHDDSGNSDEYEDALDEQPDEKKSEVAFNMNSFVQFSGNAYNEQLHVNAVWKQSSTDASREKAIENGFKEQSNKDGSQQSSGSSNQEQSDRKITEMYHIDAHGMQCFENTAKEQHDESDEEKLYFFESDDVSDNTDKVELSFKKRSVSDLLEGENYSEKLMELVMLVSSILASSPVPFTQHKIRSHFNSIWEISLDFLLNLLNLPTLEAFLETDEAKSLIDAVDYSGGEMLYACKYVPETQHILNDLYDMKLTQERRAHRSKLRLLSELKKKASSEVLLEGKRRIIGILLELEAYDSAVNFSTVQELYLKKYGVMLNSQEQLRLFHNIKAGKNLERVFYKELDVISTHPLLIKLKSKDVKMPESITEEDKRIISHLEDIALETQEREEPSAMSHDTRRRKADRDRMNSMPANVPTDPNFDVYVRNDETTRKPGDFGGADNMNTLNDGQRSKKFTSVDEDDKYTTSGDSESEEEEEKSRLVNKRGRLITKSSGKTDHSKQGSRNPTHMKSDLVNPSSLRSLETESTKSYFVPPKYEKSWRSDGAVHHELKRIPEQPKNRTFTERLILKSLQEAQQSKPSPPSSHIPNEHLNVVEPSQEYENAIPDDSFRHHVVESPKSSALKVLCDLSGDEGSGQYQMRSSEGKSMSSSISEGFMRNADSQPSLATAGSSSGGSMSVKKADAEAQTSREWLDEILNELLPDYDMCERSTNSSALSRDKFQSEISSNDDQIRKLASAVIMLVDRRAPQPVLLSSLPQLVGTIYGSPIDPLNDKNYRISWKDLVDQNCSEYIEATTLRNDEVVLMLNNRHG